MNLKKKKFRLFQRRDSCLHLTTSAGAPPTRISLSRNSGFTLAEMIVSVAIFSIVVTVSTGALLTVLATNQRAQAIETVMNNLDFALQQMSRDIRVGTNYSCGATLSPNDSSYGAPCDSFSFRAHPTSSGVQGADYTYSLANGTISRQIDNDPAYSITSPDIHISKLGFVVNGSSAADNVQPKVLMLISGYVNIKSSQTVFDLQTTVSQRLLDRS